MTYFSDTLPARRKALVDLYTAATGRKQEKVEAVRTALGQQFGETPTFYQVTHEVRKARQEGTLTDGVPVPPKQQETACLVLTDLHYGRKTASFTPDVCKARLTKLGERLIRIRTYLKGYEFDGLRVFLLGDVNDGTDIYKTQAHHQAETNVDKQAHDLTTLLADWLAEQKKTWKSVQVDAVPGNHGRCHDDQTELLTKRGWKRHDDLQVGELVATMQLSTGQMEWQPLLAVYRYEHDGPMYAIHDRENDALVTPNHRMVVYGGYHRVQPFICEMQQIADAQPYGWTLPKTARQDNADWEGITDDELRLVGWLITDGCYKKTKNSSKPSVMIYQSKEEGIEKITGLLASLGYEYTQRVRVREGEYRASTFTVKTTRPAYEFYIRAAYVGRILGLLPDKHILPEWVWSLSRRQVDVLIDALLDGDGSRWKKTSRVLWGRKGVLDQVQALCVVNGIPTHLCHNKKRGYYLSLGTPDGKSEHVTLRTNNLYATSYQGIVWCGSVPNGTLITRRNGCSLVSGNSGKHTHEAANWDIVAYRYLALKCEKHAIPVGLSDAENVFMRTVTVRGHRYLLYHGHDINAANGVPWYGIQQRMLRWQSTHRVPDFEVALLGHFHSFGMWRINRFAVLSSGTPITDDDWALQSLGWESANQTWFFGSSDHHPITWAYGLDWK